MYEVKSMENTPINFIAGDFPIARDYAKVKSGAKIKALMPIALVANVAEEISEANLSQLAGIAADDISGDEVTYYSTGEFFAEAIVLPEKVTIDMLKPAFRKLGIFLK